MSNKTTLRKETDRNGFTRRDFLVKGGLTAGALSAGSSLRAVLPQSREARGISHPLHANLTQFQFKNEPQRKRKSFYDCTDAEVQTLCGAIGYMRNGTKEHPLSLENPLQWDNWVLTHAKHCTEAKPGVVDQVHWSWFFLPWHRAYLWFLERHLANIVTTVLGQDGSTFALPYWDWITHKDIPNTRERAVKGVPSPLFGYDLSQEDMVNADGLHFDNQALWDAYRKPTTQQPAMDPANEVAQDSKEHTEETIKYMSPEFIQLILLLEFEDFAGKAVPKQSSIPTPDGMGILEHYPHNNGHDWAGSRHGKNRDMGTLRYAALDPLFFMHHANIDRIWSMYRRQQPNPDKPWGSHGYIWGEQPYPFVDIDGSTVIVTVADVVKSMNNVAYVEPQGLSAMHAFVSQVPALQQSKAVTLAEQGRVLTAKPLTINASAPKQLTTMMAAGVLEESRPLSLLEIETGPIAYADKFTINIFVNKPDAGPQTSTHDPHYVGRISAMDSASRKGERQQEITHTFSILIDPRDGRFYDLVKPGSDFSITLVPKGVTATDESFRVTVKNIRLKLVQRTRE